MLSWNNPDISSYLCAAYLRKQLWTLWLESASKSDVLCRVRALPGSSRSHNLNRLVILWRDKHAVSLYPPSLKQNVLLQKTHDFTRLLPSFCPRCSHSHGFPPECCVSTSALAMTTDNVLINQLFLLLWSHLYFFPALILPVAPQETAKFIPIICLTPKCNLNYCLLFC